MNLPALRTIRRRDGNLKVAARPNPTDPNSLLLGKAAKLLLEADWQGKEFTLKVALPDLEYSSLQCQLRAPFVDDPDWLMARMGMHHLRDLLRGEPHPGEAVFS